MKILIVDDDPLQILELREALEDAGYFPEACRDGKRALRIASAGSYAAILLDCDLPGMDGRQICQHLRATQVLTPILMISGYCTPEDRVAGLAAGADDFLGKPFAITECLARVRALVRRDRVHKQAVIRIDDLVLDTIGRSATRSGQALALTNREFDLLEVLAADEGRILSRKELLRRVWLDETVASNVVDVSIRNLRRKVDEPFAYALVHTSHGQGYVLRPSDSELEPD